MLKEREVLGGQTKKIMDLSKDSMQFVSEGGIFQAVRFCRNFRREKCYGIHLWHGTCP